MTVQEIFSELSAHCVRGMMVHDQMADYYDFLSLRGYKRCHEYHFKKESANYRKLHRYYLNHYNGLIGEEQIDNPDIIPPGWYRYTRFDVEPNTKRNAIKDGFSKWVEWEKETKSKLESACNTLYEMSEVSAAMFVKEMLKDVNCELKEAQRKHIELMSVEYDLSYVYAEQKRIHDKYKKML